ncbi:hypothetical protein SVIOM74S_06847 [Streptomyces violarus]
MASRGARSALTTEAVCGGGGPGCGGGLGGGGPGCGGGLGEVGGAGAVRARRRAAGRHRPGRRVRGGGRRGAAGRRPDCGCPCRGARRRLPPSRVGSGPGVPRRRSPPPTAVRWRRGRGPTCVSGVPRSAAWSALCVSTSCQPDQVPVSAARVRTWTRPCSSASGSSQTTPRREKWRTGRRVTPCSWASGAVGVARLRERGSRGRDWVLPGAYGGRAPAGHGRVRGPRAGRGSRGRGRFRGRHRSRRGRDGGRSEGKGQSGRTGDTDRRNEKSTHAPDL